MQATTWEYNVVYVYELGGLVRVLNREGEVGWELAAAVPAAASAVYLVFKRPHYYTGEQVTQRLTPEQGQDRARG